MRLPFHLAAFSWCEHPKDLLASLWGAPEEASEPSVRAGEADPVNWFLTRLDRMSDEEVVGLRQGTENVPEDRTQRRLAPSRRSEDGAERHESTADEKRARLKKVLLQKAARPMVAPASFPQERLWVLHRLAPQSAAYTESGAFRIRAKADFRAADEALSQVVKRHEVLRTVFREEDRRVVQQIAPAHASWRVPVVDLTALKHSVWEAEVQSGIGEQHRSPFDLSRGPLLRTMLIKLADDDFVLSVALHHIIADGWSVPLLVREILAHYAPTRKQTGLRAPELPIQYGDYARWQRKRVDGALLQRELSYWQRTLQGLRPVNLPTDRPRPAVQTYRGATHHFTFPEALARKLKSLGREEGATLFMTVLAAFQTLLGRYARQDDVAVGSPVAGRDRAEIKELIGFFVNMLVLRTDLSGDPTFRQLLRQVRETCLEAYSHQELPFERLVTSLQPERTLSREPIFQVVFALNRDPLEISNPPGVQIQPLIVETHTAKYDLVFFLWDGSRGLRGSVEYSTDLFDVSTIERMARQFLTLLGAAVADPDRRLSGLSMLDPLEREQAVTQWNQTATPFPCEQSVPGLFESQAYRTPDAIALTLRDETLTYGALNRRANQVAHYLRRLGVGPEVRVGLCMERSLEMVVAVLGILKAGGAYVPLDPDYPPRRLAYMMENSQAPVLVTQQHLASNLPRHRARSITLDAAWSTIARERDTDPTSGTTADNLAYVMYTSGSTGEPRGTSIIHRAVVRLVKNTNYVTLDPDEVFLQLASISFDASTFELWGSLLNGGKLVIYPAGTPSLEELGQVIRERGVSTLWLTATLFHQMVEHQLQSLRQVRQILAGGDVLSVSHVRRMLEALPPGHHLINGYGPTENTTFTCCHEMGAGSRLGGSIPIGRPVSNTQVYVLDDHLQPVAVGVPGELYVGGDGLARDYLHQPELTAEKFIARPFGAQAGSRIYKSGDLGRWRPDGAIEFLGRIDHQVKIRGFRVEPGEIEATLVGHEAVSEAVAMVREAAPDRPQLVAYVVPAPDAAERCEEQQWSAEHVDDWQALFDHTYESGSAEGADLAFNTSGWNSSYSGAPIPSEQMADWVEFTVQRVQSLAPQRVLELGCGTGLLTSRIAPGCERYLGTDFSERALEHVRQLLTFRKDLAHVELQKRTVDDFMEIEAESFDTVIINSVSQYLPNIDYLMRVLEGAIAVSKPGGRVFVGDVRSHSLLRAFHASVQFYCAGDSLSKDELAQRVDQQLERDAELVIDPRFFHGLRKRSPRVSAVEILIKRGIHHNELTRFRYDVLLHVAPQQLPGPPDSWLDWDGDELGLVGIRNLLAEAAPSALGVRGIPNARLETERRLLDWLNGEGGPGNVGELRRSLSCGEETAVEPEALWRIAAEMSYALELTFSASGGSSRFDALFRTNGDRRDRFPFWPQNEGACDGLPQSYGTNPLKAKMVRDLVPRLKQHAQKRLPAYMVPSSFVVLDRLPLGPSGKVRRAALPPPTQWRAELDVELVAPRSSAEETLTAIWKDVLRVDHLGVNDNFFALGGDSIMAIQLVSKVQQAGFRLSPTDLFQNQTVAALARVAEARPAVVAEQGPVTGPVPLTPIQRWFFSLDSSEPQHFNHAVLFELRQPLDPDGLGRSMRHLLRHHDALRLRFARHDSGWKQFHADVDDAVEQDVFGVVDLRELDDAEAKRVLEAASARVEASLNLAKGPLLRAVVFVLRGAAPRLLLVFHHLIVDGVSWRILLEDLFLGYELLRHDRGLQLAPKTSSFQYWAKQLEEYSTSNTLDDEVDYWCRLAKPLVEPLPVDHRQGVNDVASTDTIRVELDEEATRQLLREVPAAYRTQVNDVLLAALLQSFAAWTGRPRLLLDLERHGREDLFEVVDVSRTVGWFTALFPVRLEMPRDQGFAAILLSVKEQLRGIPRGGIGYGILRHLREDRELRQRLARIRPEISFNYLGQFDQGLAGTLPWQLARESPGPLRSPCMRRAHVLEINGAIYQSRLQIGWTYSRALHTEATVEGLAKSFLASLRALIAHCMSPEAGGATPSDFPAARLSQAELDKLMRRVTHGKKGPPDGGRKTPG